MTTPHDPAVFALEQYQAKIKFHKQVLEAEIFLNSDLRAFDTDLSLLIKYREPEGALRLYVDARIDVEKLDRESWTEVAFRNWLYVFVHVDEVMLDILATATGDPASWEPFNTLLQQIHDWLAADFARKGGGESRSLLASAKIIQRDWWASLGMHLMLKGLSYPAMRAQIAQLKVYGK